MRRSATFCVVVGILVAGCGGGGRSLAPLVVTCGAAVAEGTTVRLTLEGSDFEFARVSVTADMGTVAHLTVDSPDLISFDYTAPTFPPGTLGPKTVVFSVTARPGAAPSVCGVTIHLDPFVTSCVTSYPPDSEAAPTTGVFAGDLVVATVAGGNFLSGGALLVEPREGIPHPLVEIGAGAAFTAPGQFRVAGPTTIEFSVPDVFSDGAPTILDGSPNIGPATIRLVTPFGALATEPDCFRYLPAFLDFEDLRFQLPGPFVGVGSTPGYAAPGKLAVGDVNADGVPDIVVLAQQAEEVGTSAPDALLLLADTFGPLDRNGDGKVPDFAGSFTTQVINEPTVESWVPGRARGTAILLANLDGDPELEIIEPARNEEGVAVVLLVDIEPGGAAGAHTILRPAFDADYISGIAVGIFDHTSPHMDIAALYGNSDPAERKLIVFRSGGAFSYTSTVHDIPAAFEVHRPDALGAGDFDGDGDDDLIWGQYDSNRPLRELPILVARVDAGAGTVGSPQQVVNLTGACVPDIDIFDADGDGREDAVVFVGGEIQGSLPGEHLGACVVTFLDPLRLRADAFEETPYRFSALDPAGDGRGLTHGDFNGDGVIDVATVNEQAEVLVLLGNGDGTFTNSGRSFQIVTGLTDFSQVTQSLDAGDFDGDGLAEIVVGDLSTPPFDLVYWLNTSR